MDKIYALRMQALTKDFYARVASSFSATRRTAWAGWERMDEELGISELNQLTVLDVACGNLRFERFLADRVERVEAWCTDVCDELVETAKETGAIVHYTHFDIARALLDGDLTSIVTPLPFDLAVSFGFMHHLPLETQRRRLVAHLVDQVRVGGLVVCSFWQFERDRKIMGKAEAVPGGADSDYLLGWQDVPEVRRFCHSTSEDEIDALAASVADRAREYLRFSADGKSGDLNRYLVLRRV